MATITNPTPIETSTFSNMWVQNLTINLPTAERPKGLIHAKLLPYDGENLLALGNKDVRQPLPCQDAQTNTMITSLIAEVKRLSKKNVQPVTISVYANDPSKQVKAFVRFSDFKFHIIDDCFGLAATDAVFAGILNATLSEIARLAGLEFTA